MSANLLQKLKKVYSIGKKISIIENKDTTSSYRVMIIDKIMEKLLLHDKSIISLIQKGEIFIYQTEKDETKIDVYMEDGTIWLSQANMAMLYQTTTQNITKHIKNIYEESELDENLTCNYYLQVQNEGEREVIRNIKFYNLDMILAIGYRVRSNVGMQFRNWTSKVLKEYMQVALNGEKYE